MVFLMVLAEISILSKILDYLPQANGPSPAPLGRAGRHGGVARPGWDSRLADGTTMQETMLWH